MEILIENRKAAFNYQILEKFQAGVALNGQEVKSIKSGHMGLAGSYVVFKGAASGEPELFLIGANVPPYQPKNAPGDYNPERSRKLLLKKSEIKQLVGKTKERGLTLIPLLVYTEKGKIKIEFGLAKGKKQFDKRETIKTRETEREIRRELNERG